MPPTAPSLDIQLQQELEPGERLLWSASPRPTRMIGGFGLYLFAIPWTAFSLLWTALAAGGTWAVARHAGTWGLLGAAFPLFGLPFIAVGLAMLATPAFAVARAGRTVHAVTDRRLLTLVLGRSRKVSWIKAASVGPVDTREGPDGVGDLTIQTHSTRDSDGDRTTETVKWLGVPDVAGARKLLMSLQGSGQD